MPQDFEGPNAAARTESFASALSDLPGDTSGPVAGLPAQIGSCVIQGEIGCGGMGVVLRGHDIDFGRTLAVKVLRHTHSPNSSLAQRFLLEAQITARLQHPGIPPVHTVGKLEDGRPFFTMKLIKGQTLDVLLRESPNRLEDLPRFLGIFTQICQTLAYAHSHGVIHRDLKPGNIMVGAFGEVQVMDWGLAKVLGTGADGPAHISEPALTDSEHQGDNITVFAAADTDLETQVGNVLGTLAYMAPEQARGQVHQLDERCDVFGLGAILCVLLTGKPPNAGATKTQLHREAAKGNLTEAFQRLDACGADADLVTLTKVCLSRERADRPRHAGVVAEAMAAYQAKIQERLRTAELERAGAEIKAREERKRRKLAVGLAATVLGLILLAMGGWWWLAHQQSQRQEDTAKAVNQVIGEVNLLRGQAEAAPVGDLNLWKEALAAVTRAEDLLANGVPTAELQQTVSNLRTELENGLARAQQTAAAAVLDRNMLGWVHDARLQGTKMTDDGFDPTEVEQGFADAFKKYGLAVDQLPRAEAVRRIQGRPIQDEIVTALDMWAWKRRCLGKDPAGWERLFAVAQAVHSDPWRDRLRRALAADNAKELEALAQSADIAALSISVQVLLGDALVGRARGQGAAFLRRAYQQHPRDFWINYYLGLYYHWYATSPNFTEAIRFYTAARVANDRSASLYANLGIALYMQKSFNEAMEAYQKALELHPNYARVYVNIGMLYDKKNLPAKAVEAYQKAVSLNRSDATAHFNLGVALHKEKRLDESIHAYQKAIFYGFKLPGQAYYNLGQVWLAKGKSDAAIDCLKKACVLESKESRTHFQLGRAYHLVKRWDDALEAYKKAAALDPKNGSLYSHIGRAWLGKGMMDDAIAAFKKACDLDYEPARSEYPAVLHQARRLDEAIVAYEELLAAEPDNARAYNDYGSALEKKGRFADSIDAFENALALDPQNTTTRKNLGILLRKQGVLLRKQSRWEEAAAVYQRFVRLDPAYADAHVQLGTAYYNQGRFADAVAAYQKARNLKAPDQAGIALLIKSCEELLEWDRKLPAIRKGEIRLSNPDRVTFITLCKIKKLHGLCAATYVDLLRVDPKLAEHRILCIRYEAACAAARAAVDKGKDDPPLDDADRARWRKQALEWLRAELATWTKLADSPKADREPIKMNLSLWQKNADLMKVCAPDANLPDPVRAAWQELWRDVAALLNHVRSK